MSVRYFDDRILLTETHAWAYYRLPTHAYEFLTPAEREGLAINITVALSAIRLPDTEVHLRVVHRAYPAAEWAARGVRVNAVCPGFVETQLFEGLINMVGATRNMNREQVLKTFVQQVPMGRMQTGEDVANVVAFLASEDGGYMTGQALNICGGVEVH